MTALDRSKWRALNERAIAPNPYFDPRWLGEAADRVRDVVVAVVEEGEDLRVVLPLVIERTRFGGRVATTEAARFVDVMARRHPLVDPRDPERSLRTLLVGLRKDLHATILRLGLLPADGTLSAGLFSAAESLRLPVAVTGELSSPWMLSKSAHMTAGGEGVHETFAPEFALPHWSGSSNRRLARYARGVERELGPLSLTVSDSDERVEEFLALQAAGWKGKTELGGAAYSAVDADDWFKRMAEGFRAAGGLRIFRLGTDATAVHMYATVSISGGIFGLADAYNEDFRGQHAGTLGRVATQNAARSIASFFDPCLHPGNVQAARQFEHQLRTIDVSIPVSRPLAAAISVARRARGR